MKKLLVLLCLPLLSLTSCQTKIETSLTNEAINLSKGILNLGMVVGRRVNTEYLKLEYSLESETDTNKIYKENYSYNHKIYVDSNDIVYKIETTEQTKDRYHITFDSTSNIYGFYCGANTILSQDNPLVHSTYYSLADLLIARGYIENTNQENYSDFTYENITYSYRVFKYDRLTLAYSYKKDSPYQKMFNFEFSLEGNL